MKKILIVSVMFVAVPTKSKDEEVEVRQVVPNVQHIGLECVLDKILSYNVENEVFEFEDTTIPTSLLFNDFDEAQNFGEYLRDGEVLDVSYSLEEFEARKEEYNKVKERFETTFNI